MKPILIIPPDTIDAEGIKALNDNGICTVVAKDPAKVKFVDPIPAVSSRTELESAAIRLSRKMLNAQTYISGGGNWQDVGREKVWRWFLEALVHGSPLDPEGTREEQEAKLISEEREFELRKIAREEARAEAIAKKAAKESAKKK